MTRCSLFATKQLIRGGGVAKSLLKDQQNYLSGAALALPARRQIATRTLFTSTKLFLKAIRG
jgi:hypothetical protein